MLHLGGSQEFEGDATLYQAQILFGILVSACIHHTGQCMASLKLQLTLLQLLLSQMAITNRCSYSIISSAFLSSGAYWYIKSLKQ